MASEWEERERAPWWAVTFAILTALVWCIASLPSLLRTVGEPFQSLVDYDDFAIDAFGFVVGAVLANALVIAAAIGAILFLVFVRDKSLYRALHYFFILFFIVVAVDTPLTTLVVMAAQKNRAQWRLADLSLRRLELIALSGGNVVVDTRPAASGDAGIVEGYFRKFLADTANDRKNFETEAGALDYPAFMKPERLAARGGLHAARARLAKAHALVAKYRALIDSQIAATRLTIETSPIDSADRNRIEDDFNRGVTRDALDRERIWQLEDAIFADLEREVTLLEASRERWFLEGDRFAFLKRGDLAAFNANVRELNALQVALREEDEVVRQKRIADVVSGMPETAPSN